MSPENFTYWLNGFVELNGGKIPTEEQWKSIVEHLSTVFHKVTPEVGGSPMTDPWNYQLDIVPYDPTKIIC